MDKKIELKKGCVVFMKASSGLVGYGNAQCVSGVHHESLGTISLYGHNQHYKTYDIARIVECPEVKRLRDALERIQRADFIVHDETLIRMQMQAIAKQALTGRKDKGNGI